MQGLNRDEGQERGERESKHGCEPALVHATCVSATSARLGTGPNAVALDGLGWFQGHFSVLPEGPVSGRPWWWQAERVRSSPLFRVFWVAGWLDEEAPPGTTHAL